METEISSVRWATVIRSDFTFVLFLFYIPLISEEAKVIISTTNNVSLDRDCSPFEEQHRYKDCRFLQHTSVCVSRSTLDI